MAGKQAQGGSRQRRIAVAAGAALGTLVAARVLLTLLRGGKDRAAAAGGGGGGGCKDIKFRSSLSAAEILRAVDHVIANSIRVHDAVAAVPLDQVTYESVIEPLERLEADEFMAVQSCVFPSLVNPARDVRDASVKAEKMFEAYNAKCRLREDVYRVVKAYAEKKEDLPPETLRFVNHLVRDYERLGLHLAPEMRSEVDKIKKTIGELCITFQKNLAQLNEVLLFNEDELAGLPITFVKNLEKGKHGKLKLPLDARYYFPVMQNCKVGSTRKALAVAYDKRCIAENLPIFHNVVKLRHRLARLLGYPNHVEYVTSSRMAKSFTNVKNFLLSLSAKMSSVAAAELNKLRALKKAEEGGEEFGMEDLLYYMHRVEELEFQAITEKIREYFPVEVVTNGLFQIYQELFGLTFEEIKEERGAWDPDVRLFAVSDTDAKKTIGYFYLDIYHRDGKYSHACVCPLQPSSTRSGQLPVAAMLANFRRGHAALLSYPEVETFFHEFGHVMHHICSRPSFARFSGLRVEDDFVEAPSKMLEKWCSEKSSLKRMSGFYKDTREPVPDSFCELLVRKKKTHAGLLTKRQILLALFDLIVHSSDQFDTVSVLEQLHTQVMEGIPMLEGTDLSASFTHLMGGYDGTYYSYLWNQVLSEDMFESGFAGEVSNFSAGKEFRDKVLVPGASKDAAELVHGFLGREPSLSAFVKSRGLK
ncbi:probable thimet oligopeptidase isoform X2 [Selaginella moellendorffii]|uniref:probable thimet oligopeptidase isoform X2 n=1 Tax=Selaginella moellendorffii TaxID=88036 RepID=UPI000D1CE29D|nr:probable thimet oligopeptidase isoform X2 [Selaginella moellendorffii]|eukprot:XP_024541630.1 probable thimet oligopeptidase isoform X2 [Selaginella moellendorffii]